MVSEIAAWGTIALVDLKALKCELGFDLDLLVTEYLLEIETLLSNGNEDSRVSLVKIITVVEQRTATADGRREQFLKALRNALVARLERV